MRHRASVVLLLSLLVLSSSVFAKSAPKNTGKIISNEKEHVLLNENYGTAEALYGRFSVPSAPNKLEKAYLLIGERTDVFAMAAPAEELRLINDATDKLGKTHLRFQQVYNNLPVWSCQTIVHFDTDESIYLVGGQTIPTPTMNIAPARSEIEASDIGLSALKDISLPADATAKPELIIYPNQGDPKLAYQLTVTSRTRGDINWLVFIDAQTGLVLHKFNNIHFDGPDVGSGLDTRDSVRALNIYDQGGQYRLEDITHSATIVTYQNFYGGGSISADPDNDKVWDDNIAQKAEVAGHYYTQLSYEYFLNTHGRDSYDDLGSQILVNVHDPLYTNNAYWNGQGINFADGDGVNYLPFSGSLDVVAHELAHGVTQYTAGLIYQFQSGALNESFSDVFGVMVDRDDWRVGEEISLTNNYIRDMASPNSKGHPGHMDDYINYPISSDNGGVHRNSGIPNLACYWASLQIGRDKVEQIWYHALSTYLTPNSGFYFWAGMIMQSTKDLYGATEIAGIDFALDVVGLNTAYTVEQTFSLGGAIGQVSNMSVWVHNPGPGSKDITAVAPVVPGTSLSPGAGYQMTVPETDSSEFVLSLDATGLTECDIGQTLDSLRFDVDGSILSQIKLPLAVTTGFSTTSYATESANTQCASLLLDNRAAMWDFTRVSEDVIYESSLLIGVNDGDDTTTYRTYLGSQSLAAVDTISSDVVGEKQFRLATSDGRIQGNVKYNYNTTSSDTCGFVVIEYKLYNPCDTPLTVRVGWVADFDVLSSGSNIVEVDSVNNMVMTRDNSNTRAVAMAQLTGTAFNLRAIHNPTQTWPGDFNDSATYVEMGKTNNQNGPVAADYSQILTYGEQTIGAADTIKFKVALLYSITGTSGLQAELDKAIASSGCCKGTRGNANNDPDDKANVADISYLASWLFGIPSGPEPLCFEEGNANADSEGKVNVSDISYLVSWLFGIPSGPAPAACP